MMYLRLAPETSFAEIAKVYYYLRELVQVALPRHFMCKVSEFLGLESPNSGFCKEPGFRLAPGDAAQF